MAQANTFKNLSASGAVISGPGVLEGMYINSTNTGATMVLYHGLTAVDTGAPIAGTITPTIGYHYLGNIHATVGVYCSMTGLTANVTFHIKESD